MKDYNTVSRELLARRDRYFEEQREKEGAKMRVRTIMTLGLVSAFLIMTLVFSTIAATKKLRHPANNSPHITGTEAPITQTVSAPEVSDCVVSCNGVWGDRDLVYFDITVKKKDGTPIVVPEKGKYIRRFDPFGAFIELPDGQRKEIFFILMNDSDESYIHYEARALFYENEKKYLGKDAKIYMGDIRATLYWEKYEGTEEYYKNGIIETVCMFEKPLTVTLTVDETERSVKFEKGEFEILDGGIKLTRGSITAANVHFYGTCILQGTLYGLQETLKDAYLIYDDGTEIPLGHKTDAGTIENGEFTIGWIVETLIEPDRITGIRIDGITVAIE